MKPIVLICGEKGQYPNYVRAVTEAGGRPYLSRSALAAAGCDALLLPGGGDVEPWRYGQKNATSRGLEPERDAAELALLEQFTAVERPVLGICRGLQVINVFFGGTLVQDLDGHSAWEGIDRLHCIRQAGRWAFAGAIACPIVNSAHHQGIDRLGSGLEATQWAPDGIVEAVMHKTLPILGVQWHPERLRRTWRNAADGPGLVAAWLALCRGR